MSNSRFCSAMGSDMYINFLHFFKKARNIDKLFSFGRGPKALLPSFGQRQKSLIPTLCTASVQCVSFVKATVSSSDGES